MSKLDLDNVYVQGKCALGGEQAGIKPTSDHITCQLDLKSTKDTPCLQASHVAKKGSQKSINAKKTIARRIYPQGESFPIVRLPPKVIGGLRDQVVKIKQCNCKRSNCLKLYCDCFQCGIHCSSICNCRGCENVAGNTNRAQAILVALDRRPNAFRPRILSLGGAAEEGNGGEWKKKAAKGCKCKMSKCLKKYCECFDAAVYCSPSYCKCVDCCNLEGNSERETLMSVRQRRLEAAAVFASQKRARISTEEGEEQVAATVGVDAFLPPLAYAIPVKFSNGVSFPGIAFTSTSLEQTTNPITAILEKDKAEPSPPVKGKLTELETAWCNQILKIRRPVAGDQFQPDRQKLLKTAETEAKRLIEAVNGAKEKTIDFLNKLLDQQVTNNLGSKSRVDLEQDQTLLCTEVLPPKARNCDVSSFTSQELAILIEQDTALLRELTAIIRQKTFVLTQKRMSRS
mmetsp:Transcript_7199/g.10932  ORF Transcript_7199/g.10932 Transcript_7199/m.10932 type:complete len:457 (-) Transcript_7199:2888-4258(-)